MKSPIIKKVLKQAEPRNYLIGWFKPQVKGNHKEASELADMYLAKNKGNSRP